MKIVLDTNVLIAALIASGTCTDLLEHCVLSHTIAASDFIFDELRRHLVGKFNYTDQDANEAIVLLRIADADCQAKITRPACLPRSR